MSETEAKEAVQRFQENKLTLSTDPMRGYDHGIEFYEADHVLTPKDREAMAQGLAEVAIPGVQNGILGSFVALALPTVQDRFQRRRTPPVEGAPKVRLPFIKSPFLSLGLAMMTFQAVLMGSFYWKFSKKRDELTRLVQEDSDREANSRLLKVWNILPSSNVLFWLRYYSLSADDPTFIMKDPRHVTKEDLHEVHYNPKALGSQFAAQKEEEQGQKMQPHWQQIRQQHGYVPKHEAQTSKTTDTQQEKSVFDQFGVESEESNTQEQSQSKWDQIRKGLGN